MANNNRVNLKPDGQSLTDAPVTETDVDPVKGLFGPRAEVVGKGGLFAKAAKMVGRISISSMSRPELKEYALSLAENLEKAKDAGAINIGQSGMFLKIQDFFENIYPNFYPEAKFYVKENDRIETYVPLLLSFKPEMVETSIKGGGEEKQKEFDPRSLNSQDLAVLLEEYQEYLDQGKSVTEAEELVARFLVGIEPTQAQKVVRYWLEQREKRAQIIAEASSGEKEIGLGKTVNDRLLLEVEVAKGMNISEQIAAKIIDYSQRQTKDSLISEQDLASAVSVVGRQEEIKLSQPKSEVLQELKDLVNKYIAKELVSQIALQTAKGIIDPKETKQQQQIGKIIEELVILPMSNEEVVNKVSRVAGREAAPMLAKKVAVAALKIIQENQTLVLIRQTGALEEQMTHELILMKKMPDFSTKNLKTQKEIWEAVRSLQKITEDVYLNPAAKMLELSRIQIGLSNDKESRRALLGVEAIVGLAGMQQPEVDRTATDFNKQMRVVSRHGIRNFGNRLEALDNAIKVAGGEKGKLMLDQIRQRLDKVGMLNKLGKVEQLSNLSVSGLSKKVFEALGGQELLKKVITQLGADGLVKGSQVALAKLSGGMVAKAASWIATRLGINVAVPGLGTAISVVLIAKDLLGVVAGKIKGALADLGIHIGFKKFVEENFGKVPGALAGIIEDGVIVFGSALMGISLAFLLPIIVAIFVGLFAYQMFVAMNASSLVPPKPATSFVLFDAKKYPGGVIPPSCPSGWPIDHGYMTQGPMTTDSHRGAQALDLANVAGTPIYATHDGIVQVAGYSSIFGNYVILAGECENPDTKQKVAFSTLYGHMIHAPAVNVYDQITRGTLLGMEGSTGNSTGPHVHYQLNSMGSILSFIPVISSLFSRVFGCIGVAACGVSF